MSARDPSGLRQEGEHKYRAHCEKCHWETIAPYDMEIAKGLLGHHRRTRSHKTNIQSPTRFPF
jgi:hypothetical protein